MTDDAAALGCRHTDGPLSLVCSATQRCNPLGVGPQRLRIVDWNIKAAQLLGLDAVIDTLRALHPDVVLLQEVDRDTERTGHVDQPQALARGLGDDFEYVFAPTIELEGGTYGIAMLSRLPFAAARALALNNFESSEPRTAIDARLCVGQTELRVVSHHADTRKAAAADSCLELLGYMLEDSREPTMFAGDLNQLPNEPGPMAYVGAGLHDVLAPRDASPTLGNARIDYLFVDDALAQHVLDARVEQTDASDHELLVTDLLMGYQVQPVVSQWRIE